MSLATRVANAVCRGGCEGLYAAHSKKLPVKILPSST